MADIAITLPLKLWDKIVAGKKTIELRKRIPKDFDIAEDWCYVVEKGKKRVLGRMTLTFCRMKNDEYNRALVQAGAGVPGTWIEKYYKGHRMMCLWCIKGCKEYSDNIGIGFLGIASAPQSYVYVW